MINKDQAGHGRIHDFDAALGGLLLRVHTDAIVRLLALPYADHPDFDESWRP